MLRNTAFWSWFLQRITAIFLALGLVVHFVVLHFFVQRPLTFEKVRARLSSPGWVIFDILLLAVAIYHALNGIWAIILDYDIQARTRKWLGWGLAGLGLATFMVGVYIILPFTGAG